MKISVLMAMGMVLCVLMLWLAGCNSTGDKQLGETGAEVHRRHVRSVDINGQEIKQDLEKVLFIDQPSKLTGRTMP